jgi:hypothetical protein
LLTRVGWHELAPGVRRRAIVSGERSQLWEWRLAPATAYDDERHVDVAEEIVTAIRGEVRVENGGTSRRLRRGGSMALTEEPRRIVNPTGSTAARLLWFQVHK